jgi:hypothetical protein
VELDLAGIWHPTDVIDGTVVAVRNLVWVLHHFVDEIAQVQHEAEPSLGRRTLVFPDHPAKCVLRAFVDALAGDEREPHRT